MVAVGAGEARCRRVCGPRRARRRSRPGSARANVRASAEFDRHARPRPGGSRSPGAFHRSRAPDSAARRSEFALDDRLQDGQREGVSGVEVGEIQPEPGEVARLRSRRPERRAAGPACPRWSSTSMVRAWMPPARDSPVRARAADRPRSRRRPRAAVRTPASGRSGRAPAITTSVCVHEILLNNVKSLTLLRTAERC